MSEDDDGFVLDTFIMRRKSKIALIEYLKRHESDILNEINDFESLLCVWNDMHDYKEKKSPN